MAEAQKRIRRHLEKTPNALLPAIVTPTGILSRDEVVAEVMRYREAPLGEWPSEATVMPGLSVAIELLTGKPLPS